MYNSLLLLFNPWSVCFDQAYNQRYSSHEYYSKFFFQMSLPRTTSLNVSILKMRECDLRGICLFFLADCINVKMSSHWLIVVVVIAAVVAKSVLIH